MQQIYEHKNLKWIYDTKNVDFYELSNLCKRKLGFAKMNTAMAIFKNQEQAFA